MLLFILVLDTFSWSLFRLDLLLSRLCVKLFCLSFLIVLETISGSRPGGPVQVLWAPWRGCLHRCLGSLKSTGTALGLCYPSPLDSVNGRTPPSCLATLALLALAPSGHQPYRLAGGQPVRLVPPGEGLYPAVEQTNIWHFFVSYGVLVFYG